MVGSLLIAMLLFALARARAIVTNECQHNVWIWSFPFLGSSHTENVPIKPGGQYQESWRLGSLAIPGIAIKISTQPNGIYTLFDEVDFAYSIKDEDKSKVWVNLTPVDGEYLINNLSFHSCNSRYNSAAVEAHECDATDEVELVLCGNARTTSAKDTASLEQIQACYQPNSHSTEVSGDEIEYHVFISAFPTDINADNSEEQSQNPQSVLDSNCKSRWNTCPICHELLVNNEPSAKEESSLKGESLLNYEPPKNNMPPSSHKLPVVRQCHARVVYPGRRAVRISPTLVSPITRRKRHASLCHVVQKYHSSIRSCNEEALEAYARAIYPRICEPEYEALLIGFPCDQVAQELKTIYPEVTGFSKEIGEHYDAERAYTDDWSGHLYTEAMGTRKDLHNVLRRSSDDRECLSNFCEPALPGISCANAARKLRAMMKSFGASYTDVINDNLEDCPPTPMRTSDGRPVICILKLCALIQVEFECAGVQALLRSSAKAKLNMDIEFSIDEAICGS
jgi:hypothetical protein